MIVYSLCRCYGFNCMAMHNHDDVELELRHAAHSRLSGEEDNRSGRASMDDIRAVRHAFNGNHVKGYQS